MSKLDIAKRDGMVELPNGEIIRADLSHDEFRISELFENSRITHADEGVADYQFGAGEFKGKRWRACLSFFNQLLLHLDLWANLYPPDEWNLVNKDFHTEVETKQFHERVLAEILGPPEMSDNIEQFRAYELSGQHLALAQQATWRFPWGVVTSTHSFSEGTTNVRVTYATRPQRTMKKFVRGRRQ